MLFTGTSPSDVLSEADVHYIFSAAYRATPGGGH